MKAREDIHNKNSTIDSLLQELESMQAKQGEVASLTQKLQASERQVLSLTNQLHDAQLEVSSLQQEVSRLKSEDSSARKPAATSPAKNIFAKAPRCALHLLATYVLYFLWHTMCSFADTLQCGISPSSCGNRQWSRAQDVGLQALRCKPPCLSVASCHTAQFRTESDAPVSRSRGGSFSREPSATASSGVDSSNTSMAAAKAIFMAKGSADAASKVQRRSSIAVSVLR